MSFFSEFVNGFATTMYYFVERDYNSHYIQ
jgi:hypothetical protein